MKITTKKTVEVETEITLPAYYKTIAHQLKIYSETNCICITNNKEISIQHVGLAFALNAQPSTETEFLTAYSQTLITLNQLI